MASITFKLPESLKKKIKDEDLQIKLKRFKVSDILQGKIKEDFWLINSYKIMEKIREALQKEREQKGKDNKEKLQNFREDIRNNMEALHIIDVIIKKEIEKNEAYVEIPVIQKRKKEFELVVRGTNERPAWVMKLDEKGNNIGFLHCKERRKISPYIEEKKFILKDGVYRVSDMQNGKRKIYTMKVRGGFRVFDGLKYEIPSHLEEEVRKKFCKEKEEKKEEKKEEEEK